METLVKTPHGVFFAPQQLVVPLFQRPYVWSREVQWTLLWEDVRRLADRMALSGSPGSPHFLGAVVLQQQPGVLGSLSRWTIIDGQQRLTTLQLLLDAAHQVTSLAGAEMPARRIEDLVRNPAHFCEAHEDQFKVWPTNRDRPAFNEVMAAGLPVDYPSLHHRTSRMASAHAYFSDAIGEWIAAGDAVQRGEILAHVLLNALQMVVIQLAADENAQEIFETLNARGTPLSAADLIKNFVFQRLDLAEPAAEDAYLQYWQEFETAFWEKEVSAGRVPLPRSSLFLNQWLVAQTADDVTAREVFSRFKRYAEHEAETPMVDLLPRIHRAAGRYRAWTEASERPEGSLTQLELFAYRAGVLESEVIKPLIIWATDPDLPPIPADQMRTMLAALESWLVRRALLRLSTKNYNRFLADLLRTLTGSSRDKAGDLVEAELAAQDSVNTHWPGDDELRTELATLPIYRRLKRARVRMVLEAVEDYERGFRNVGSPTAEARIRRGHCAIEHVMPQQWEQHWPIDPDPLAPSRREALIHVLGNLTLLTSRLNSKVSNGPWLGETGKLIQLDSKDVLLLNRRVRTMGGHGWDEETIRARTDLLIDTILQIWPVPEGHVGLVATEDRADSVTVTVADLLTDGLLTANQTLHGRGKWAAATATVLPDGRLQVGDGIYDTPSGAGKAIRKRATNGWHFWRTDSGGDTSLRDLRNDYAAQFGVDAVAEDETDAVDETNGDG
jgi:hypothetical protein